MENKKRAIIEVLDWVKVIAIAIVIALFLRVFVFEIVRVEGTSMLDTLNTNQRVYIDKLLFRFTGPKREDIVECYFANYDNYEDTYIKRVIALGGETIEIRDGKTYINGIEYEDPYYDEAERNKRTIEGKWVVPEDCVFVMGDNRDGSSDSRMPSVGFIPRRDIIGRGVFVVWPLGDIKKLY